MYLPRRPHTPYALVDQTAPVNHGLEDRHPYVRRTASMGVLKIYHIDANIVLQQGARGAQLRGRG